MYRHFLKRFIDITLSFTGIIIISPVFIVIWIMLAIANKKDRAFFLQERPGKDEKIFKVVKFKTMTDRKDTEGNLLPDANRLTPIGAFIRKTSLDEIPQLINVLKGDMSLIGPRPLLPEYLGLYNEYHRRRHEVRPGITGLAQVNGRNVMKFSERFNHDVYYVDNLSFGLDIRILLLTVKSVFFKTSTIKNAQTVDEVDDLGVSKYLNKNHFKK